MSRGGETRAVSLRRLFPAATFVGCPDIEVQSVAVDSRTIEAGQTFVAVRGAHFDGHQYITEAAYRGAVAVVTEQPIPHLSLPLCVVPDTREAYAVLCQALEGDPAARLKLVGITGTNGKTTTSILVKSILEAAGHRVGLIGTIEQFDGNTSFPSTLTTPGPDVIARLMRRMVDARCSHAVMEVSSHALEQRRVAGLSFDVAVFTNLSQDHLDYHHDLVDYARAKGRLFRGLGPDACAILNADDPQARAYAAECPAPVVDFAVRGPATFEARDQRLSPDGSWFSVTSRSGGSDITTPLVGEHNVYNCLAALAVARTLGIDWSVIERAIHRVAEVPGRLQAIRCGQPFHVFVDYAHTPQAIASVLRTLRAITKGRLLCLFGAGGDRDRTKRPLMAQAAESVADVIVVTSDNPRSEDPQRIITDILAGFRGHHGLAIEPDRRKAIGLALSMARPGDCVVLAGKGHESYQIVGNQRHPFDDRLVAAEILAGHGTTAILRGAGTEKKAHGPQVGRAACGA